MGQQRAEAEGHAHRERQPAGEQERAGADPEPERAPARSPAPARMDERLEQGRGRDRGEHAGHPWPEQPAERREQDAVGRRVVAAVPLPVPDREPLCAEQLRPEDMCGHVDRVRPDGQPDGGHDDGRRDGRQPLDPEASILRCDRFRRLRRRRRGRGRPRAEGRRDGL